MLLKASRLLRIHFQSGPIPIHDNPQTLSVPYVSSLQYGTDSVCGLSFFGVGPDQKWIVINKEP